MKTFKQISEERGEKAYKQAIDMGLKYGGFGYWKDPQTGETKFKTENDTLVPVEGREESELYKGEKGVDPMGGPDGSPGMGLPGQGGGMGGGMPGMGGGPGQGTAGQGILGAPEAGAEQVQKDRSWEPGPDGSTCVGPEGEDPGRIPEDSYVGRTNFIQWRAGPDGSNITNTSPMDMVGVQEETQPTPKPVNIQRTDPKLQKQNDEIKQLVQNPKFDLDQSGKHLGSGNYGEARVANEKHEGKDVIIKQGEIFKDELGALKQFHGRQGFPRLVNAELNVPWKRNDHARKAHNQKNEETGEIEQYGGKVAMEKVGNMELFDAWDKDGEIKDKQKAVHDMWELKKQMHQDGWYHGDLHDGNIMWDSEEQMPALIDFGKAENHPFGALMEALGSRESNHMEGVGDIVQNYINPWNAGSEDGSQVQSLAHGNFQKVRNRVMEMAGIDPQKASPKKLAELDKMLEGRNPGIMRDYIEEDLEDWDFMQNNDNVFELIKMFYDGIGARAPEPAKKSGPLSLKDRMANAFAKNFDHDD